MKIFKPISLLFFAGAIIASCNKDDNNNGDTNWAEELKQTTWAGEYQLTSGAYQGLQPFSIKLNTDNTLTWYEIGATLPAVWSVRGNQITITFTNGGTISADLGNNSWNNFTSTSPNQRKIASLEKISIPDPNTLNNTVWKGKLSSGQDVTITFLSGNKLRYFAGFTLEIPYTIYGAGLKLSSFMPATNSSDAYVIISNNFMKGFVSQTDFGGSSYFSWTGTKQ
jgi:hypothetical protein